MGVIVGEVLSMGVLFRLTADMDEKSAFAVCGGVGVTFSIILFFMISEPEILPSKSDLTT